MNDVKCVNCGQSMPIERLEFYLLCKQCNNEKPNMGFSVFSHKTAPEIQIIKNKKSNIEAIRRAKRANKRAR